MQGETSELCQDLCAQAAIEQDSAELLKLIAEITRILEEKQKRLAQKSS